MSALGEFERIPTETFSAFEVRGLMATPTYEWPECLKAAWLKEPSELGAIYSVKNGQGTKFFLVGVFDRLTEIMGTDYIIRQNSDGALFCAPRGVFEKTYRQLSI